MTGKQDALKCPLCGNTGAGAFTLNQERNAMIAMHRTSDGDVSFDANSGIPIRILVCNTCRYILPFWVPPDESA